MGTYISGYAIQSVLGSKEEIIFDNLKRGTLGYSYSYDRDKAGYQVSIVGKLPVEPYQKSKYAHLPTELEAIANCVDRALKDSEIKYESKRIGIIVSTDSNVINNQHAAELYWKHQKTKAIPGQYGMTTLNSHVSLMLAKEFDIRGLSLTISAACAGGGHAVGIAHMYLQEDLLDVVIVIGHQELNTLCHTSFDAMRVFSKNGIAKPFDSERDGLIPSGGTAVLILSNSPSHNKHGEIVDYGFSVCKDPLTPDIDSLTCCMDSACRKISTANDVVYVSAHATGTKIGDAIELQAIYDLFDNVSVTSTKALTGHECWMSGISEIIYTLIQLKNFVLVKQHNFQKSELPIAECMVLKEDKFMLKYPDKYILSNSFGFGGTNSSILIKPWM